MEDLRIKMPTSKMKSRSFDLFDLYEMIALHFSVCVECAKL